MEWCKIFEVIYVKCFHILCLDLKLFVRFVWQPQKGQKVSYQLLVIWDLICQEAQYVQNCVYAKSSLWLDGFISWGYTISKPNIKRNFQSPLQRFTMTHSKCEFASDKITIYNILSCQSCIWGQFYFNFSPSGWFSIWNI